MSRGFRSVVGAAWTPCGLCGKTRMQHHMGETGTRRHAFITTRDLKSMDPLERLGLTNAFIEAERPIRLPRCTHGNALWDNDDNRMQPECGCCG